MKLLIVDDQNSVHMFFDKMLAPGAFGISHVLHAYHGAQALNIIEEEQPDIMMLDVKMPVMDGMETLQHMKEKGFMVHTVILSAYNEFEYARQALLYDVKDYLLKPIDWQEVSELLTSLVQHAKEDTVRQLQNMLEESIEKQETPADDFTLPFQKLGIAGFGFLCMRSEDWEWLSGHIKESIVCTVSMKSPAGASMTNFSQYAADTFTLALISVEKQESWKALCHMPFLSEATFIGFSLFHESAAETISAMKQAIEALKQGFYEPSVTIYDKDFFSLSATPLELELAEQIRNAYMQRDVQEVKLSIERLFNLFKRNKTDPEYVQEFCYSFLLQLNKDFITTFRQLKGNAFLSEFNCYDAASLKNMLLRIIINMQCDFKPSETSTDTDVVCRIKKYIELHYEQDLSLDTMSKHFFIGKYQISRVFKKTYGINYSDYILKIRMENAALLLKTTSYKLYEVARRTGFEETSYFSNVFKKYYGITPNEYRKEE